MENEFEQEVLMTPLTVGSTVPEELDFEIFQDDDFGEMSFKALRGKWVVLVFYPADFTFVCPTELAELASLYPEFQKLGAEVVSVSTDTKFVHKAWHDHSDAIKPITYPMAADPTHLLSELFGVLDEETGLAHRGTFIIDPDGEIKGVEVTSDAIGRSAKETFRKLKAAQFVAAHPANVCPASWDEGDDVLTPGADMVGKI